MPIAQHLNILITCTYLQFERRYLILAKHKISILYIKYTKSDCKIRRTIIIHRKPDLLLDAAGAAALTKVNLVIIQTHMWRCVLKQNTPSCV